MAKVFDNILISGLRGKVGKQLVFRVINGVTIASRAPGKPDRKKETEAQRRTRTTFRAASQWAKAQLADPEKKRYYMQLAKTWNLTNAYTAAVKDYMRNAHKKIVSTDTMTRLRHEPVACIPTVPRLSLLPSFNIGTTNRTARIPSVESVTRLTSDSARTTYRSYLALNEFTNGPRHGPEAWPRPDILATDFSPSVQKTQHISHLTSSSPITKTTQLPIQRRSLDPISWRRTSVRPRWETHTFIPAIPLPP